VSLIGLLLGPHSKVLALLGHTGAVDTPEDQPPAETSAPIPLYPDGPLREKTWDVEADGPLTQATLEARFAPPARFRVSPSRYPVGSRLKLTAAAGLCFVIRGTCRLRCPEPLLLRPGQYAALPGGDFELRVVGSEPVELIRVFEVNGDTQAPAPAAPPPAD
jgi:hypothetical protein